MSVGEVERRHLVPPTPGRQSRPYPPPAGAGVSESGPSTPPFVLGRNHCEWHAVRTRANTLQWASVVKPAVDTVSAQLGKQPGWGEGAGGPGAPLNTWATKGTSPQGDPPGSRAAPPLSPHCTQQDTRWPGSSGPGRLCGT